ncbi:MAG: hypothetical protein Q3M30_09685 [Candidatus Electrothrix sp. Rat3]|nr:hypothetical protein [Candidatus Electrothrix rattekaaiensis]
MKKIEGKFHQVNGKVKATTRKPLDIQELKNEDRKKLLGQQANRLSVKE